MSDSQFVLSMTDVVKTYKLGETRVHALRGLNLKMTAGEFTAVVGTSGSGKSTMLHLIGGIDRPDSGIVKVGGKVWSEMSDDECSQARNSMIGFIFQSFNLMPTLNVFENIELPLLKQKKVLKGERQERVQKLLADVGLEAFAKQRPDKLSGGQRQRVAIARALVTQPLIVIADEPTANLDSETTATIIDLMRTLNVKNRTTFIFSTHDEKLLTKVDRKLRMKDGQLVSEA